MDQRGTTEAFWAQLLPGRHVSDFDLVELHVLIVGSSFDAGDHSWAPAVEAYADDADDLVRSGCREILDLYGPSEESDASDVSQDEFDGVELRGSSGRIEFELDAERDGLI